MAFFTLTPKCRCKTLYINMLQLSHKKNTSHNAPFRTFHSKTHSDISYQKSMNRLLSYLPLSRQNILRHSTQKTQKVSKIRHLPASFSFVLPPHFYTHSEATFRNPPKCHNYFNDFFLSIINLFFTFAPSKPKYI